MQPWQVFYPVRHFGRNPMDDQAIEYQAMAARPRLMADEPRAVAMALEAEHKRERRKPKGIMNAMQETGLWNNKSHRQEKRQ